MGPEFYKNPYVYLSMIGFIVLLVIFFRIFEKLFREKPINIIIAVKKFRYEYMKEYLKNGGDINIRNKLTQTLLMIAADKGMKLVKRGSVKGSSNMQAVDNSNPGSYVQVLRLMEFLLSNGADPNLKDKYGQTALFFTADSPDCVALLLKHGADIDAQNNDGETVLMRAAKIRDYYIVKDFYEKGADPLIKDKAGKTAVQYAIEENHESIIEFFAEKGLDVSETGSEVMR